MNCSDWEERVALYAGGDASGAEADAVEGHVADCAGCQVLLSGLRESLGLLREAHAEPVDAAHFAAVRARVLGELERNRRPWWAYALVAAAMVLLVLVWPRQTVAPPSPVAQAITHNREADPMLPVVPAVRPGTQPAKRSARAIRPTVAPAESIVIKLLTDDPDVIIYWITESKGD